MFTLVTDNYGPETILVTQRVSPGRGHPLEHVALFTDADTAERRFYEDCDADGDLRDWMAAGAGYFLPDGWTEADDEFQERVLDERDKAVAQWWQTDPLTAIRRWFAYDSQGCFIVEYAEGWRR